MTNKERKQLALYMWRTGSISKQAYDYANQFNDNQIDISQISLEYAPIGKVGKKYD